MIALVQDESVPNQEGKVRTGLRLAFVKTADGWAAICDASKEKNAGCRFDAGTASQWIVRGPGKPAHITASGWLDMEYPSETGLLKIVSGMPPRTGRRTRDFAGWSDNPVYPPLVATNINLQAAARWQAVYPEKMTPAVILPVLTKQVAEIPDCTNGGQDDPPRKGRPLAASDIHVFETWQTKNGELLVGAGIKPELVRGCDYTADSLADVWLYQNDGEEPARALPALIEPEATHRLIAIADFAGDGNEEALFWLSGYDEDGFVLYYDRFRKAAKFAWSYH